MVAFAKQSRHARSGAAAPVLTIRDHFFCVFRFELCIARKDTVKEGNGLRHLCLRRADAAAVLHTARSELIGGELRARLTQKHGDASDLPVALLVRHAVGHIDEPVGAIRVSTWPS